MNATVLVPRATEENECEENPMPRNQSIARTITNTQNTDDDPISGNPRISSYASLFDIDNGSELKFIPAVNDGSELNVQNSKRRM